MRRHSPFPARSAAVRAESRIQRDRPSTVGKASYQPEGQPSREHAQTGQPTQCHGKSVGAKGAPDLKPIQQALSVNGDGVPIVELVPASAHTKREIP